MEKGSEQSAHKTTTGEKKENPAIMALKSRGFRAIFVADKMRAKDCLLELVPRGASIGIGDSTTLYQIDVIPALEAAGHTVVHPFRSDTAPDRDHLERTLRQSLGQDVFITGANAVTEDGLIVSVDGAGNRVAGMVFGAGKVILAVGQNKIVKDLPAALERIRKVISPGHAKNRGFNTPCVRHGECVDCRAEERICNATLILHGKPLMTEITVILVGEDLGLGWDPEWPRERIEKIRKSYLSKRWCPDLRRIGFGKGKKITRRAS
jgi:hypothetical protein